MSVIRLENLIQLKYRLDVATKNSPIAVFSMKNGAPAINSLFANTVKTQALLNKEDNGLIGVYTNSAVWEDVVRDIKYSMQ